METIIDQTLGSAHVMLLETSANRKSTVLHCLVTAMDEDSYWLPRKIGCITNPIQRMLLVIISDSKNLETQLLPAQPHHMVVVVFHKPINMLYMDGLINTRH